MGSQVSSFCLKMWECAKPSMADIIWDDQKSSDLELSRMSACKMFFLVELLHCQGVVKTHCCSEPIEL
eukprot:1071334-Pelagomonas_calceolata.AAC.1